MTKVTLISPTPWPHPFGVMQPTGTVLEVSDEDLAQLVAMGKVSDSPAPVAEAAPPVEVVEVEPVEVDSVGPSYGPLPGKTEPVTRWKEYARENGIKLTGVTKRTEIMGYITKVVNSK